MLRPGVPPVIITWADPAYIAEFRKDIEALRPQVDIVVASCHWGLGREPLQYMTEIGRAAIDAGADVVMGHGPHYSLPVGLYKGRPIFYNLGNFAVHRWGASESAPTGDRMTDIERSEGGNEWLQQYINLVAIVAQSTYQDGKLREVRLFPVDLGVDRANRAWSKMSVAQTPSPQLATRCSCGTSSRVWSRASFSLWSSPRSDVTRDSPPAPGPRK